MSNPDALVRQFCALWNDPDPQKMASYFSEDAVYHNIPMAPIVGRENIEAFITGFISAFERIDFHIHRQIADGETVMNERTDTLHGLNGQSTPLPVMGVFEIVDGKISAWRDYFDMAAITAAIAGTPDPA
ncbi:nuclear transport factor 2 family protein [Mycobacteroides abscessus]|uniref:nuclear transport factor 2 family protein n=1 Tax=Mycobacteroides abscessus TaxID=36809 RepID=UPI00148F7D4C|nr:nuclear transport factor 2 family protein [Mycobacteroides abscessus]